MTSPAGRGKGLGSSLIRLDTLALRAPQTLWHGRVPRGDITLLVGHSGRGKSTLAVHLASAWSNGKLSGHPEAVLLISAEDDAHAVTGPRLLAAGADGAYLHVETDPGAWRFPRDFEKFAATIAGTEAKVAILDPLVHVVDNVSGARGREALEQLAAIARDRGITLVLVHHFVKSARSVEQAIAGGYGVQSDRSFHSVGRFRIPS